MLTSTHVIRTASTTADVGDRGHGRGPGATVDHAIRRRPGAGRGGRAAPQRPLAGPRLPGRLPARVPHAAVRRLGPDRLPGPRAIRHRRAAGGHLGRAVIVASCPELPFRPGRTTPGATPGEQLREIRLEHAELVAPRVAQDPEVVAALLLVVPSGGAERFEALDLGFNVVGFEVEVHSLLGDLLVVGPLKQYPDLGIRQS